MNLKKYLMDKIKLIIFYLILMIFISAVVYLDGLTKISLGNIIYINTLGLTFFLIYLLLDYLSMKEYYKTIIYVTRNRKDDILTSIPKAKTHEQALWCEIVANIYREQQQKLDKLYDEKRESSEFVSSWVHEVKTPIAVSRLIIENSWNKSKDEILSNIEEELDKIDSYVEQALYYSKIDDFSKDYFINENSIELIVKELVKKNAKFFINKKIKIELLEMDMNVCTDKKWLIFILDQILSNSLKYTNEMGKITITTEVNTKEKVLVIEDTGIGIKPEDLDRVFDKGFTGYNGRKEYKSTGMGLYLSKRLALKLGHDISIESLYGKYTKVRIHFPKLTDYLNVTKM